MSRLLITNGVQQGRVLRLRPGLNRIGRSIGSDFQLSDPSVSGSHCEIILSEGSLTVRDLNSSNGTFVAGVPVKEAELLEGQLLQLGNTEMRVERDLATSPGPTISVPEIPAAEAAQSPTLADGALACVNHPEVAGEYRCSKCQATLCQACVRMIHRIAGETMAFCSVCSGACESLIQAEPPPAPAEGPTKNLLGRVRDTLKLPFKRPPR